MELLTTMFQDLGKMDVVLGKTGTILLGLILVALAVLNAVQFYKAQNVARLTSALSASEVERKVHEEASKRKSHELEEAHKLIGDLQAKTDIKPLMEQATQLTKMAVEQMELSRKFDREYAQVHTGMVTLLSKMDESGKQRYDGAVGAIQSCVDGIAELRKEIAEDRKRNAEEHQGIMRLIGGLEARMPKGRS